MRAAVAALVGVAAIFVLSVIPSPELARAVRPTAAPAAPVRAPAPEVAASWGQLRIGSEQLVAIGRQAPKRVVIEPAFVVRPTPTPAATPVLPAPPSDAGLVAVNNAVSVPGATVVHRYTVFGSSAAEVIADMEAKGPWVLGEHWPRAVAYTWLRHLDYRPGSWSQADAGCTFTSPSLAYEIHVWLPSWSPPGPVSASLAAWWRTVLDRITSHEQRHVNDRARSVPVLERRLRGQPCAASSDVIDAWRAEGLAQARAWDAADLPIIWPAAP